MASDGQSTLGDFFTLRRGKSYNSRLLDQPGPILLGLASIQRNGGFRSDSLRTFGGDSPEQLLVRPNDLYVSLKDVTQSGDLLGAVARLPKTSPIGRLTQDTVRLDPRSDDVPKSYLYWLLRTPEYHGYCRSRATGTTTLGLSREDFLSYPVAQPTRTRKVIVDTLEALDDKIELNRRMNGTLEKTAAAIFKSWFIDFDPVHAKVGGRGLNLPAEIAALFPDTFEDCDLGPIPEGWTPGKLADIADNPRRTVKLSNVPPTTPYMGLQHMPRRCIALDAWGRADEVGSGKSQFKEGEILFGKLRPYFHKVGIAPVDGVCSTDILVVVPKSREWHSYALSLMSSKVFVDYTDSHSGGTKMPRTNWKDMGRYPLALPPEPLARAFQDHVAAFHERIGIAVRQIRRLAGLRDTLLPKLLSGEIELPEAEAIVEGGT